MLPYFTAAASTPGNRRGGASRLKTIPLGALEKYHVIKYQSVVSTTFVFSQPAPSLQFPVADTDSTSAGLLMLMKLQQANRD